MAMIGRRGALSICAAALGQHALAQPGIAPPGIAPPGIAPPGIAPPGTTGGAAFLSAGADSNGRWRVAAFGLDGAPRFDQPIPARGHGSAVASGGDIAVLFGRRPGAFALALATATGRTIGHIERTTERWFAGHGTFSADGSLLYATEIDTAGQGIIGVYAATGRFRRIGEFPSGGTDPHDVRLAPDGASLFVANGGVKSDPRLPRARFDLDRIDSNLAHLNATNGKVLSQERLNGSADLLSLRHLAIAGDGSVFVAMQFEGPPHERPPLVASVHDGALTAVGGSASVWRALENYTGSAATSEDGNLIAVTSPRGGIALILSAADGRVRARIASPDSSGVAPAPNGGFVLTSGLGGASLADPDGSVTRLDGEWLSRLRWDNHLVALPG